MPTLTALDPVALFVSGGTSPMIKYTPEEDVAVGDVVVFADVPMVAHLAIGADELGALASQGGVYRVKKSAVAFTAGDAMYFDVADDEINKDSGNYLFGVCTADAEAGDDRVEGIHCPLLGENIES